MLCSGTSPAKSEAVSGSLAPSRPSGASALTMAAGFTASSTSTFGTCSRYTLLFSRSAFSRARPTRATSSSSWALTARPLALRRTPSSAASAARSRATSGPISSRARCKAAMDSSASAARMAALISHSCG